MRKAGNYITKMIKRMERAGFVERRPDPEDERVSRVHLTQTGYAIIADMQTVLRQVEAETFVGFSAEERSLLRQFMIQIRDNLTQAAGGKTAY